MPVKQALRTALKLLLAAACLGASAAPITATAAITPGVRTAGSFACSLTSAGNVSCWGSNFDGAFGTGNFLSSTIPVPLTSLTLVQSIAVGYRHACALRSSGGVACWGNGGQGQLGNGTNSFAPTPVDVTGLTSGVKAIAANGDFTCALTTAGGVKCWGGNSYGQLGDGSTINRNVPVDVTGLSSGVVTIGTGYSHACAVTSTAVKCWGANLYGQLGNGTTTNSSAPVDVTGAGSGYAAVAAGGNHTCALSSAGSVACWGYNASGQVGDGGTTDSLTPVILALGVAVQSIELGDQHTCALDASGGIRCWGDNAYGALGIGTAGNALTPTPVPGLASGVQAIGAGGSNTCAMLVAGGIKCWGSNIAGQVGAGSVSQARVPTDVPDQGSGVLMSRGGQGSTCFLKNTGGVKCMGDNAFGQLGNGTSVSSVTPVDVTSLTSGVVAIASGSVHACALTSGGAVKCWGEGGLGQLGDGLSASSPVPVTVSGLASGVVEITSGQVHSCARTTAGAVKCWGHNGSGQLGDGTTTLRPTPVDVTGMGSGALAIDAAAAHTCAVAAGGAAKCWGSNYSGQLGNGTTVDSGTPVQVSGLTSGIASISAGDSTTCARTTAGAAKCWGGGYRGALGNGNTANSAVPVDVLGFTSGVTAVSVGSNHVCAIRDNLGVTGTYCWGANSFAELGLGEQGYNDYSVPQLVNLMGAGALGIDAGFFRTCAQTGIGGLRCWGNNGFSQNGIPAGLNVPNDVINGVAFWRNASGVDVNWAFRSAVPTAFTPYVLPGVDSSWNARAACNVSRTSPADVVWFQPSTGQVAIWMMTGAGAVTNVAFPAGVGAGSSWQIAACGDLDGDGFADLVWRNGATGEVLLWYLNGDGFLDQAISLGVVPLSYSIRAVADVNGDARKDIVFFDQAAGQVVVYQMIFGGSYVAQFPGNVGPGSGWNIYKAADFDGDGKDDLLWRNADGSTAIWYMNGASVAAGQFLYGVLLTNWDVAAAGNFAGSPRRRSSGIRRSTVRSCAGTCRDGRHCRWLTRWRASAPGGPACSSSSGERAGHHFGRMRAQGRVAAGTARRVGCVRCDAQLGACD